MVPIGFTVIDWKSLSKISQEHLGESITKRLDAQRIDLTDPTAFVRAFQGMLPTTYHPIWDHFNLMILCEEIPDNLSMSVYTEQRGKKTLYLVSGTLKEWRDTVVYISTTEDRKWANEVYSIFAVSRLSCIWDDYTKRTIGDCFELCHR